MKEFDIRPPKVFEEYLRLAKEDIAVFFSDSILKNILCPACNFKGHHSFKKDSFDYCECPECLTLYVNPRPTQESFTNYYTNSLSSEFWAKTFYKETEKARREKIWKPKAQIILDELKKQKALDYQIVDIGGGYGIFAEETQKLNNQKVIIIEPSPHLSKICRGKGIEVVEKFLENVSVKDLPSGKKCFVSFELFEHLHSPKIFLKQLNRLMQSNDLFIFTTLSSTGLDIQVLWEKSPSVSPPHHLNFFNPNSVKLLLEHEGYECLNVSTPGKLDIDILFNNKEHIKDKFWKTFIQFSNKKQKEMYQKNITNSGWSSHMMVVSKKI